MTRLHVDVLDRGLDLVVEVALAGILESDIDVTLAGSMLIIRADRPPACPGEIDPQRDPPGPPLARRVELPHPVKLEKVVFVARHPFFERDGLHLGSRAGIDLATALLGGSVTVPLLRGEAELTIPPGTQPGQQFRLGGRGLSDGQGRRGDLFVGVQVELPRNLTEEQKRLVREFARRP